MSEGREVALNRFTVANFESKHKKTDAQQRRATILQYISQSNGCSSVDCAWGLMDTLNPSMGTGEMALYLHKLEVEGILMFKGDKYCIKEVVE